MAKFLILTHTECPLFPLSQNVAECPAALCSGLCSSEGPSLAFSQPYSSLWVERPVGPPGTCAPLRSHSELALRNLMPQRPWVYLQGPRGSLTWVYLPRESWCVQTSFEWVVEGLFIEDEEGDWMWEQECSRVCARPLEMLIWARVGRRRGAAYDGLASLCH